MAHKVLFEKDGEEFSSGEFVLCRAEEGPPYIGSSMHPIACNYFCFSKILAEKTAHDGFVHTLLLRRLWTPGRAADGDGRTDRRGPVGQYPVDVQVCATVFKITSVSVAVLLRLWLSVFVSVPVLCPCHCRYRDRCCCRCRSRSRFCCHCHHHRHRHRRCLYLVLVLMSLSLSVSLSVFCRLYIAEHAI